MQLNFTVADLVHNGSWSWPIDWVDRFIVLANLAPPVWEYLRPRAAHVPWYSVVWFSRCIPRHAFVLWLLMGERLKTQDRLKAWEIHHGAIIVCPLCNLVPDTHDHLFFSCPFASQVWTLVLQHIDFPISSHAWKDFALLLSPFAKRNIARFVIIKLLFAASVYFIWQERNRRIFKKGNRSPA
ncbi:uncharacterized protein [Rutidosis leptorrhynchoides]|uniref:uncharacterized protein n=1 Tax=Rutidosis leptorrhynchoides TaxID=125765 RepID=UPI003A9987F4